MGAPWQVKFKEHQEAFQKYKASDSYQAPEKKLTKKQKAKQASKEDGKADGMRPKKEAETLGEAPPEVLAEATKEGLAIKLKALLENPKLCEKGDQVLLDALRTANGNVVQAKRALL